MNILIGIYFPNSQKTLDEGERYDRLTFMFTYQDVRSHESENLNWVIKVWESDQLLPLVNLILDFEGMQLRF